MKFPPETLMAYADGELDAQTRREIEAEMAVDPEVAQEIERHRALRAEVGGAFAGVLEERGFAGILFAASPGVPGLGKVPSVESKRTWIVWFATAAIPASAPA